MGRFKRFWQLAQQLKQMWAELPRADWAAVVKWLIENKELILELIGLFTSIFGGAGSVTAQDDILTAAAAEFTADGDVVSAEALPAGFGDLVSWIITHRDDIVQLVEFFKQLIGLFGGGSTAVMSNEELAG